MGVYTRLLVRRYLTTRIIPLIAVGAVALCVALVIIVVSVMTGFLDALKASGRTLMGDVVINYPVQGIPYYQELIQDLEKLPEVAAATPLVDTFGLVRMPYPDGPNKDVVTANIWAIEPTSFSKVTGFDDTIYWKRPKDSEAAKLMKADDPRLTIDPLWEQAAHSMHDPERGLPGALLGIHVSVVYERQNDGSYRTRDGAERWWMPFHEVTVTLVPISERGAVSQSISRVFRVVNEVMSGVFQVDKNRVFIPLKDGQEMLRLDAADIVDTSAEPDANGNYPLRGKSPAKATQILIRAAPGVTPAQLAASATAAYEKFYTRKAEDRTLMVQPPRPPSAPTGNVTILTWEQRLRDLIGPVEKERQMMRILFSITYLVCAGLILAIFWSIVSEKTRDIGILRAVGASRAGVLWIFLRYGLVVGVAGSAAGTFLGWVVVRRINDIHEAMGHDSPTWVWVMGYVLAGVMALLTLRSLFHQRALSSLMWAIGTLVVAGAATGLMLHRGFLVWDPAVYYFTRIPSAVDWWSALGTCVGAIVFSVLGAAVPAARAADIDPVRALRYE